MELPNVGVAHATIRGQWLLLDLHIRANSPMVLAEAIFRLENGSEQSLPGPVSLIPGQAHMARVRLRLPAPDNQLPHFEQNSANQRARLLRNVLWIAEQAEQQGKVLFRLADDWHEVPVTVRV